MMLTWSLSHSLLSTVHLLCVFFNFHLYNVKGNEGINLLKSAMYMNKNSFIFCVGSLPYIGCSNCQPFGDFEVMNLSVVDDGMLSTKAKWQLEFTKANLTTLLDVNYSVVIFFWRATSHEMLEDRRLNIHEIHENSFALFGLYIIPFHCFNDECSIFYLLCLVWLANHSFSLL